MSLTGLWQGTMDGTQWGRLLIKINEVNGKVDGQAEISDVENGTFNLDFMGQRHVDRILAKLISGRHSLRKYPGSIEVDVNFESETLLKGNWKSSIGTFGTFRLERHSEPKTEASNVARKIEESNKAFIIMAFSDSSNLALPVVDIREAIRRACGQACIVAHRIDDIEHSGSITNLIVDYIKKCRFLIADLTHERPNVYYEIGYAHGMQKDVILTAFKDTKIHFDIASFNVIFYSSASELESRVARRLKSRIENTE